MIEAITILALVAFVAWLLNRRHDRIQDSVAVRRAADALDHKRP